MAEADVGQSDVPATRHRRPGQTVECGWCGRAVEVPARGRVPSWCSSSCRHRAWEARRADREQPGDVRVVTRTIEVERPTIRTVEVPVPTEPRTVDEWEALLQAFATRLAQGRIYRRDLPTLDRPFDASLKSGTARSSNHADRTRTSGLALGPC